MTTYTYEVDHGDESPAITAGMEINGGKLTAVQFDSALARLEKLENVANEALIYMNRIRAGIKDDGSFLDAAIERAEKPVKESL